MKSEKQLYQWDVNQYLIELQPTAEFIDYPIGNEVIRIKADGTRCRIPDEVLQTYGGKTCYERYPDGTFRAYSFSVLYAPKPPDYVYTPEERTTFEALTARVDAAIEEIKRRADSGEFTPVKGVDYFTDAEKNEMMENVSSGAVGEFRKVVDTETTEYNDNHNLKLAKYNANASEKLTTYDTNAEQHTSDYNRNAEQKLEAYNQNHTEKVAEYNQNAAALQTEVDRLRGECDNLAAENRKQENRISALLKLNKGQTYDILPEEGETASRTAPSGAKYVSVDKVGGKSIVEGGVIMSSTTTAVELEGKNLWDDSDPAFTQVLTKAGFTFDGTTWKSNLIDYIATPITIAKGSTFSYDIKSPAGANVRFKFRMSSGSNIVAKNYLSNGSWEHHSLYLPYDVHTAYVDYSTRESCEIKNIQLEQGTTETAYSPHKKQSLSTGFPELHSAGTAHDEIVLDGGQATRNVYTVELEALVWERSGDKFKAVLPAKAKANGNYNTTNNELCNKYESMPMNDLFAGSVGIATHPITGETVWIFDSAYDTPEQLVASLSGAVLHYELATPTTEPVTIPEALQEWLPVEPGGTVTFKNADESKQLAVPNAVSWVRKLNEVE